MTHSQQSRVEMVLKPLQAIYPEIEALYRDLHEHPELSMMETQTAAKVAQHFIEAGFEVTARVGGTGVVGMLHNGPGPTVLLRADMDALPVEEKTNLPYASHVKVKNLDGETVPVMHACGHDGHSSCLVGTAQLLSQSQQNWRGTLLLVAQPAEESLG